MRNILFFVALFAGITNADPLVFSPLCSTGAVLQQAEDVRVWGTAPANQSVSVHPTDRAPAPDDPRFYPKDRRGQ